MRFYGFLLWFYRVVNRVVRVLPNVVGLLTIFQKRDLPGLKGFCKMFMSFSFFFSHLLSMEDHGGEP